MKNVTTIFNKSMKMSDLIDADYRLLLLLQRLNIPFGFGDKNVEAVCSENSFNSDCFVFLANFQSNKSIVNPYQEFEKLPIEPFLSYLKSSHTYFLEDRLPNVRRKLLLLLNENKSDITDLVLNFFDLYTEEVNEHMKYEDETVFPYIRSLINKENKDGYNIDIFKERHNDIDEKVNDLKQILMKYLSGIKNQHLATNILLELYMTQEELETHTFIEDELIIPHIKKLEKEANKK